MQTSRLKTISWVVLLSSSLASNCHSQPQHHPSTIPSPLSLHPNRAKIYQARAGSTTHPIRHPRSFPSLFLHTNERQTHRHVHRPTIRPPLQTRRWYAPPRPAPSRKSTGGPPAHQLRRSFSEFGSCHLPSLAFSVGVNKGPSGSHLPCLVVGWLVD